MAVATILSPGVNVGGKYEVVEVIGFGGMGVVYKVREQVGAVSRIRALKTVLPQFASDPSVVRRFRQEAEKMCMLEHENIVPVLSYSEEGQFPYLVMPFIEGQTLKEYLAEYTAEHGRGLPLSEVMEIGLELLRGLEVAHRFVNPETRRAQPMVHRDIKPGNIMVRVEHDSGERRLKVLIMDFGIAKVLSDKDSGHSLTEVIGTVKYASPEQIRRGKDIDPRADIYSLGMVLYELYAGRHMFTGLSEHAVLMRMVQRDLKDMEIPFPEGTPPRFRQLIERCVAVDRERRFPNVGEMRTVMRRILEEDSERIAKDVAQARDRALSERAHAVEQGAQQYAAEALAEGDALLSQGDAAIADHRQSQALPSLRAAADAFARAAQDSAAGRERDRLAQGLAALAELRAVALAAGAERLTPQSVAAAAEATRVVERALEAGDFTGGGRALEQAERAWGEAHAAARREHLRVDAAAACDRLDAALAAARGELARLPAHLGDLARLGDVGVAEARADAARRLLAAADFVGASEAAAAGMALVAEADQRRTQRLGQLVDELSKRLRARLASVDPSPDRDAHAREYEEARAAADAACRVAAASRNLEAVSALESAITGVEELERELARRAAEREQALLAAERNRNAEPKAREALEALHRARTAVASAGAPASAETASLAGAVDEAERGEADFQRGEYAAALPLLRSAGQRLNDLAEAIARRTERERLLARLTSLRAEATEKTKLLGALGPRALDAPQSRRLLAALSSAEERAAQGDHPAAIRILEEFLPELDKRIAEARAELERERERAEATAVRGRAEAALSACERLGERAMRDARFAQGRDDVDGGRALCEAERFAEAAGRFAAGEQALVKLGAEIEEAERAERAERLAALAQRRATVVERLTGVPNTPRARRRLKAIRKALGATERALAAANESEAARRLDQIDSQVRVLLDEAAAPSAVEGGVGTRWRAVAIGGGAAAAASLLATLVWTSRAKAPASALKIAEASRTPVVSEPAAPRSVPSTAEVAVQATAAPVLEPAPTAVSTPAVSTASVPTAAVSTPAAPATEVSTAAVSAAATAATVLEATAPPLVAPRPAESPAPLVLASARPRTQTVKVRARSEPRFDASLKNGDDASLEWRLDGEMVGHGPRIVLGKEATGTPGRKRLEVAVQREGSPTSLRSWNVEIEASPLGFASLEPANRSFERIPGSRVSFRAPVNFEEGDKLAFLWQVNGEPVRGAEGPAYDFQPQSPGEYVVQVRATAPWGESIANVWNLSVRPPVVPTPDLSAQVAKSDVSADAQAWIQEYCRAFEKKDVDALLALGHLTSQAEAARLRDALSSMHDLKVSCTNPSIRATGDDVVVSFDRTDRWTDPFGTTMERALPRITKHLHRANGRWVAAP